MSPKVSTSVSLDPELVEKLDGIAGTLGRSRLIEDAVRARYGEPKKLIASKMMAIQKEAEILGCRFRWEFER